MSRVKVLFYQLDPVCNSVNSMDEMSYILQATDKRSLVRFLVADGGAVEDYMGSGTTHVVSTADWDSTFDDAVEDMPALLFVRPEWIVQCHKQQSAYDSHS